MNIIRNLRLNKAAASQWIRFCSKGGDESKRCADLKASTECGKKPKGSGKEKKALQKVTLIDGDGIGCELVESLRQVFSTAKVPVEWEAFPEYKVPKTEDVSPEVIDSLKRNKVGIKGPIKTLRCQKQLRKKFDLYAFVAVCQNLEGQKNPYDKLDCVIIRDVMEGEYSGIEHYVVKGVMQSIKVSTAAGANRIARYVFRYAMENARKKITVAHKANIMHLTDGNFLTEMRREAAKHTDKVMFEERYMDTACLNLIMKPKTIDVLVSSSMYGDVLVMMASSIMGGKTLCPGYGVSSNGFLYDTLNKSNEEYAGRDVVNPTGMILSGALMLRNLKLDTYADKIECAVHKIYKDTDIRTPDLGGKAKTSEFTKAVCDFIKDE